jgi:23S rRNA (uracil1939-C5)-methyltransferase
LAQAETALARGQRLTLSCERMAHGGACIAHAEGTTIFVEGAIPGETVIAELRYSKAKVWFAKTTEVIQASPHRVEAPCPYFGECGGCQLQHVDYGYQVELKKEVVMAAMHHAKVELPSVSVHPCTKQHGYRWRGEFHVIGEQLGFNRMGSWDKIPVDDCLIHHETIRKALPALRDLIRETKGLHNVHLTVGDGGKELLVVGKPQSALPDDVVAQHAPDGAQWSTDSVTLRWRDLIFRARSESFIQVNQHQAGVLYDLALGMLGETEGKTVVDAYAGIGMLSCAVAKQAGRVICIENNRDAASLGVLNAKLNGMEDRIEWIPEPVEDSLSNAAAKCDALIVDPPRAGCDSRVTGWLALAGPPKIVYISCDPATMARDLKLLTVAGPYKVEDFAVVDMFPQTYHVECVAQLNRTG